MKHIIRLINWWRVTGKLIALYVFLLYLITNPFVRQFPTISVYLPDDKFSIPLIAASLYLMMQILLALYRGEDKGVALEKVDENENFERLKTRLKRAKHLDLICSTSETFHPILKEIFETHKINCRLLLRHPQDDEKHRKWVMHYVDSYLEAKQANPGCNIQIKFCCNTFSRIIIADNAEVYFGFYELSSGRLRANQLEMIHAKSGSHFGNFILNISKNRFQSVWDTADDSIGIREKLVY